MDLDEKLIQELMIQSNRDLEEAQKILEIGGYVEHVAWNCEQAYEKAIKSIYTYFKLKIQSGNVKSVYDKLYEKQHFESYKLVTNMFREIAMSFRGYMKKSFHQIKEHPDSNLDQINALTDFLNKITPMMNKKLEEKIIGTETKIEEYIKNANTFSNFVNDLTVDLLRNSLEKIDVSKTVPDAISQLSNNPNIPLNHPLLQLGMEIAMSNSGEYQKFYGFIVKALLLATFTLPHTSMSRYPSLSHNFKNLEVYRDKESALRPFFELLISEIKKMNDESKDFLDVLHGYKEKNMI